MTPSLTRRQVLAGSLSLPLNAAFARLAFAGGADAPLGAPQAFDFDRLTARAKMMASQPYAPFVVRGAHVLERIDYDAHWKIRFKPNWALWPRGQGPFPVRMFHPGRYQKESVKIHLSARGQAREVLFAPDYFTMPDGHPAQALPKDIGFSGFRVMHPRGDGDWLAFLGASYFRSAGALDQYGLSARGLAIDTALASGEEFPRFTEFWLEAAPRQRDSFTIYALLDGPSVTGAYRFLVRRTEGAVMDVRARVFARRDIERLGAAPLTSMFWFAEHNRQQAVEWRPEIHDSDGLAIWTGAGERIWRPLNNPPGVQTNSFLDVDPKGFGLLQRDRAFANYEDPGANYDKRPSVWVEPLDAWGRGVVQLVEIPTDDEIHDNIVAYWVPETPMRAGAERQFDYRLHWLADEPFPARTGRVVVTRTGLGGIAGQPRPKGRSKFVIDFAGGPLDRLPEEAKVAPVVTAARGSILGDVVAFRVNATRRWRATFDVQAEGPEPVDLRCYLRLGDKTLTETWLYQHFANEANGRA